MTDSELKTPVVGADIEALCGKCGDVWHVVAAMVENEVAKVMCKQCGGTHKYRPPGGAPAAKAKKTRKSTTTRKRKTKKTEKEPPEPLVEPDLDRPIRAYAMTETYEPRDRIEHPRFGTGVVEQVTGPGRISVFFADGRKILVQAAPPRTVELPSRSRSSE